MKNENGSKVEVDRCQASCTTPNEKSRALSRLDRNITSKSWYKHQVCRKDYACSLLRTKNQSWPRGIPFFHTAIAFLLNSNMCYLLGTKKNKKVDREGASDRPHEEKKTNRLWSVCDGTKQDGFEQLAAIV